MSQTQKVSLRADILVARGKKTPITLGIIKMGPVPVAHTTKPLAGRYSEEQMLRQFRANRSVFTLTDVGRDLVKTLS